MFFALLGLATIAFVGLALVPDITESSLDEAVEDTTDEARIGGDAPTTGSASDTEVSPSDSEGQDHRGPEDVNVLFGNGGSDIFEVRPESITYIQDYDADDLIMVSYDEQVPEISFDQTDDGLSILADGFPIAILSDVYDIDISSVFLNRATDTGATVSLLGAKEL